MASWKSRIYSSDGSGTASVLLAFCSNVLQSRMPLDIPSALRHESYSILVTFHQPDLQPAPNLATYPTRTHPSSIFAQVKHLPPYSPSTATPIMSLFVAWMVSGVAALPISPAENSIFSYKCSDIEYCRTIPGIVWSCLATIFACTWVAVHPNVPAPKSKVYYVVLQRIAVTVCGLLVPEYIVAWSIRQWLVANQIVKEVADRKMKAAKMAEKERLRMDSAVGMPVSPVSPVVQVLSQSPQLLQSTRLSRYRSLLAAFKIIFITDPSKEWTVTHGFFVVMGGFYYSDELPQSKQPPSQSEKLQVQSEEHGVHREESDVQVVSRQFLPVQESTVSGSGYISSNVEGQNLSRTPPLTKCSNLHPASREDIMKLIQLDDFKLPTKEEINDKSKGDPLSKTFAILQTLWFVIQCSARRVQSLPITKLELVTLAYAAITVAMYRFWWAKPLNVSQAIHVPNPISQTPVPNAPGKTPAVLVSMPDKPAPASIHSTGTSIRAGWIGSVREFMYAVVGIQDNYVDLRSREQVPTFFAGKPDEHLILVADFIALVIALVFGSVHCIAWSYVYPSYTEQLLWRISAATIVVVPVIFLMLVIFMAFENRAGGVVTIIAFSFLPRTEEVLWRVSSVTIVIMPIFFMSPLVVLFALDSKILTHVVIVCGVGELVSVFIQTCQLSGLDLIRRKLHRTIPDAVHRFEREDHFLPQIRLEAKLPPVIKALQLGWLASFQTSASVNGLFAVVAAILLMGVKASSFPDDTNPRALTFLTLLSYASLVFTMSATVTSLILADRLGEIPIRASQQADLAKEGSVRATPTFLIKRYGAGSAWGLGVWHWIFCMLSGIWCIFIQLLVFIFLQESTAIKTTMTCLLAFSTSPFLLLLLLPNRISSDDSDSMEG
ncbi:hypothetical protein HWV62_3953 [Athelia sp. TMB]|nr:hypothetical protein HWV62_3953 [Athelia sp. TMB]